MHRLDPRTKQALLLVFTTMSLWGDAAFLSLLSVATLSFLRAAGVRFGRLIRETRFFLYFLLFVFLVRTVTVGDGWIPVFDIAAVSEALIFSWRLLVVVLLGLLMMATTRTAGIRAALTWYLRPLPFVNERMAATMVGLLIRFLPVILIQASEITDAQRARGIDRRRNLFYRTMYFSIALFRSVFNRADELAEAMQARCYNENRTLPEMAFTRRDAWAACIGMLGCVALVLL